MRPIDAITIIDAIEPNAYTQVQKYRWIMECEGLVWTRALLQPPIDITLSVPGTAVETVPEKYMQEVLAVPAPYDKLYPRYLQAQIHYANGEYDRYAASMQHYNAAWSELIQWLAGDLEISDRRRNKHFTVPIVPDGYEHTVLHVPEGHVILGARLVIQIPFSVDDPDDADCGLYRSCDDEDDACRDLSIAHAGSARVPILIADRGGFDMIFWSNAAGTDGTAFFTGTVGILDEERYHYADIYQGDIHG